jgi:VWFA-related protein
MRRPVIVLMAMLWATAAVGQGLSDRPTDRKGEARETVRIHAVNVEAFVTAGDFELFEDARPVPISGFYEAAGDRVLLERPPGGTSPVGGSPSQPRATGEAPVNIAIYIDGLHLRSRGRRMVVEPLIEFVGQRLLPGITVTVAGFDRGLWLRCAPTTDHAKAVDALRAALSEPTEGTFTPMGSGQDDLDERRAAYFGSGTLRDGAMIRHLKGVVETRFIEFLAALAELPGRTQVLYVSDGFPHSSAYLRALRQSGNAGQVSVYPINARPAYGSASVSFAYDNYSSVFLPQSLRTMVMFESTLAELAEATGGRSLFAERSIEAALTHFVGDISSYYSLAYSPKGVGRSKYHRLEVKVQRPGLVVRHREGYLERTAEEETFDRLNARVLFGGSAEPLGLRLVVGESAREGRKVTVPLEVRVATDKVALVRDGDLYKGDVSIGISVLDEKGANANLVSARFPIKLTGEEYDKLRANELVFSFTMKLRSPRRNLVVSVRDEVAMVEAAATSVISSPPATS